MSVHGKEKVEMEQIGKVGDALPYLVHRSCLSPSRDRWIGRLRRDLYKATKLSLLGLMAWN